MKLYRKLMHSMFDENSELISELIRAEKEGAESTQNFEEQYSQLCNIEIPKLEAELEDKLNLNVMEVEDILPVLKEGIYRLQEALKASYPKIVSAIDKAYNMIASCTVAMLCCALSALILNPSMEKVCEVELVLWAFFIELYKSRGERIEKIEHLAGNLKKAMSCQEKLQMVIDFDHYSIFDDDGEFNQTLQNMKTAIEGLAS